MLVGGAPLGRCGGSLAAPCGAGCPQPPRAGSPAAGGGEGTPPSPCPARRSAPEPREPAAAARRVGHGPAGAAPYLGWRRLRRLPALNPSGKLCGGQRPRLGAGAPGHPLLPGPARPGPSGRRRRRRSAPGRVREAPREAGRARGRGRGCRRAGAEPRGAPRSPPSPLPPSRRRQSLPLAAGSRPLVRGSPGRRRTSPRAPPQPAGPAVPRLPVTPGPSAGLHQSLQARLGLGG